MARLISSFKINTFFSNVCVMHLSKTILTTCALSVKLLENKVFIAFQRFKFLALFVVLLLNSY